MVRPDARIRAGRREETTGAHHRLTHRRGGGARVRRRAERRRRLSPLTQSYAQELATESRRMVILCGHYEGVDERVRLALAPEEVALGDYVLTGGELPALVLIDATTRLVPGVLGDPSSAVDESFSESLLEYPQYTRPAEIDGITVPEVLLSGHHEAIRLWRRKQALRSTYLRRPDLLRDRTFTKEDRQLLDELMNEGLLTAPLLCEEEG